jgi:prophage regulatory protein
MRKLIRLPEVKRLTGKSRSQIYKDIQAGKFRPVKIGPRAIAFVEDEVAAHNDALIAKRDRGAA